MMDSKQAKLKLSDWVEYLSNTRQGSYKTVELEYEDAQEIAELITQQDKMIELACEWIADYTGECPIGLSYVQWEDCDVRCTTNDNQEAICWRKYLQSEVEK